MPWPLSKQQPVLITGNSTLTTDWYAYLKQGQLDDAIKELNTFLYQNPNRPGSTVSWSAYVAQETLWRASKVAGVDSYKT